MNAALVVGLVGAAVLIGGVTTVALVKRSQKRQTAEIILKTGATGTASWPDPTHPLVKAIPLD